MANTRLFLDMDGVFCDFERGAQEHTGDLSSRDYPDEEFWPLIMKTPFFQTLHPMQNAMDLWSGVQAFLEKSGQRIPIFLTGCPKDPFRKAAEAGKEAWIRKHFLKEGGHIHTLSVPVEAGFDEDAVALSAAAEELLKKAGHNDIILIFCRPDQKYFFTMATPIPILLDDRERTGPLWKSVRKDAIFLHHLSMPKKKANYMNKKRRDTLSENAVKNSVKYLETMKGGKLSSRQTKKRRQY
jgi:hypothetical protein